jgi:Stage II sporulation protein E (SpoIIE)
LFKVGVLLLLLPGPLIAQSVLAVSPATCVWHAGDNTAWASPGLDESADGVVEARSAAGELFGFDRTRAISTESAESIARAASTHGQEDDITVLTLTFTPAELLRA